MKPSIKCEKCGNTLFNIQHRPCCDNCPENAALDPDTYKYTVDQEIIDTKGLTRTRIKDDGICNLNNAFGKCDHEECNYLGNSKSGDGCYLFVCTCGAKTNLPLLLI